MSIEIRADKTAIVLERIEGDASGNNDRQRLPLVRLTLLEAQALAEELDSAITAAAIAVAEERKARLVQARAELAEYEAKAAARRTEIWRLEEGEADIEPPAPPPRSRLEKVGDALANMAAQSGGGPSEPVSADAIDAAVLTAAASMVPAPSTTAIVSAVLERPPARSAPAEDNLAIPDFLVRTA